jgi:hypothetical protein
MGFDQFWNLFILLLLAIFGPKCVVLGYTDKQCQEKPQGYNRACDFSNPSASCSCQSGYITITSPGSSCCFHTSSGCAALHGNCDYGDCRLNPNCANNTWSQWNPACDICGTVTQTRQRTCPDRSATKACSYPVSKASRNCPQTGSFDHSLCSYLLSHPQAPRVCGPHGARARASPRADLAM